MKILFDTSVLLASLLPAHPAHEFTYPHLERVRQQISEGFISNHSLAELYNKLTRVPIARPIPAGEAQEMLQVSVIPYFTLVSLTPADYQRVIQHLAQRNLIGGIVYDALILHAGIKAGADRVLTLNPRHFRQIYPEMADRIVDPTRLNGLADTP